MNKKEHIEELINLYSLGLLEGDELREVEDILRSGDKYYLEYFENVYSTFSNLPYSVEDKPLSADLKNRILNQIETHKDENAAIEAPDFFSLFKLGWFKVGFAVACLLFIYLGYSNYRLQNSFEKQSIELASLKSKIENKSEMMDFLENNDVKVFQLANHKNSMNINARLLWDLNTNHAILYIVDIPKLKQEKTYQFWTDSDKGMESMGTFTSKGDDMIKIKCMPKLSETKAFYISIEPKGGMPHPTGQTYKVGEI